MQYQYIVDPGHGWLKVPLKEIEGMTFTAYSFKDSRFAYLEEDSDMSKFMRAKGLTNDDLELVHVDYFNRNRPRLAKQKENSSNEHLAMA